MDQGKISRRFASPILIAAYALTAAFCEAQQTSPTPVPTVVKASDGKENQEAKKVVEQEKPPEPRFKIYGWIEGGITMATLEALSQGLVPIMSDAGDAFLLEHARCGIVCAKGDQRGTTAAIVALLRDHHRIIEMRERALRFAREDWTARDMVIATEAWYRSVSSMHRPGASTR